MADLEAAIRDLESAAGTKPKGHPGMLALLKGLGNKLESRYERLGEVADIERAIRVSRLELGLTPDGGPDMAVCLNDLGNRLEIRYEQVGEMADLEEAIRVTQQALGLMPEGHPDLRIYLNNLGTKLENRYEGTGNVTDLEDAVRAARRAISATPEGYPDMAACLSNLGGTLRHLYQKTGDLSQLEDSIRVSRQAVDLTPENNPDLADRLNNLGSKLRFRYERTGKVTDLEEAITVARRAIDLTPENHPGTASRLHNLGDQLFRRYERVGKSVDLDEAVSLAQTAVDLTLDSHPSKAGRLNSLGLMLAHRYRERANMLDLQRAIQMSRRATDATRQSHINWASRLNSIGNNLALLYDRTGDIAALEEAIRVTRQAIHSTSKDYPARAAWWSGLGAKLNRRYERTGGVTDIEEAIQAGNEAVDITPEDHPNMALWLNNLGNSLEIRYERLGERSDLETAVEVAKKAVNLTPGDSPHLATRLSNLGNKLRRQFERTGSIADLDEAIQETKRAINITSKSHFTLSSYLSNLGNNIQRRYERTKERADIDEAVDTAKRAIDLTPQDHPDRASRLTYFGYKLEIRYQIAKDMADRDDALDCFCLASDLVQATPLDRVRAARAAIGILQATGRWQEARTVAEGALELLHLVHTRSLNLEDRQYAILQTSGLAADCCSITLKCGDAERAVQQLETGRGILLGYMINNRSDLSALKRTHPVLGERYETIRFKATRQIDVREGAVRDELVKERREAAREMEDCLAEIRQLRDYGRFRMEPTIDELKSAAADGAIVIVNVTDFSSDAIVICRGNIKPLPLLELSARTAPASLQDFELFASSRRGDSLRTIASEAPAHAGLDQLSWLWDNCVKLVVDELETMGLLSGPEAPRVWWMGSGIAGSFPFHAAGLHLDAPMESALDLVVSSYTPTIKMLAHSRSRASSKPQNSRDSVSVLVVTMPTTPSQDTLWGVGREDEAIDKACQGLYSYKGLPSPTADSALEAIRTSEIAHFACHGSSDDMDPSLSHLLLQRSSSEGPVVDKLAVSRISSVLPENRFWIAFLSACSTAQVKARKFADEGLSIASSFQVAGYAHVIGAMWSADDDSCVQLAETFYSELIGSGRSRVSNRAIAMALHRAVADVRAEFPDRPEIWAPFVHLGA